MSIKTSVQRHPLVSYFILAYGITWGGIFVLLLSKGFELAALDMPVFLLIFFMMLLGPSTSSLILTAVLDGRSGFHALWTRFRRWQVDARCYAVALLTIPVLLIVILTALSAAVSPAYAPGFQFAGLVFGLLAGGIEEIGWTGFATPRLLKQHDVLKAGFILGVLWALWHALADFSGNFSAMGVGWLPYFIAYWLLPLTGYRILMTWIYSKTGSLLVAQLMHASYTGWLFVLTPAAALSYRSSLLWQSLFAVSLWAVVAVVVASNGLNRDTLLNTEDA